jgi:hypothetical protein
MPILQTAKLMMIAGGALVLQAYEAHIQWQVNAYKGFKAKGKDVSIAIFSYGTYHSHIKKTKLMS